MSDTAQCCLDCCRLLATVVRYVHTEGPKPLQLAQEARLGEAETAYNRQGDDLTLKRRYVVRAQCAVSTCRHHYHHLRRLCPPRRGHEAGAVLDRRPPRPAAGAPPARAAVR